MKKTICYTIVIFLITMLSLQSCKKTDTNTPKQSTTFTIKNANDQIIQALDPALIIKIHKDLLKNDRNSDAAQLYAQYDTTTGYLKSLGKTTVFTTAFKNVPIDSSKISSLKDTIAQEQLKAAWHPTGVYGEAWVQKFGWSGPGYQIEGGEGTGYQALDYPTIPSLDGAYVGTVGRAFRLEGFYLNSDSLELKISYSILSRYPNSVWTWYYNNPGGAYNGWNQFVGTQGKSAPTCEMEMAFSSNPNFPIYYITQMASYGWLSWCSDGETAGLYGIELQAFAYIILQY